MPKLAADNELFVHTQFAHTHTLLLHFQYVWADEHEDQHCRCGHCRLVGGDRS